MPNPSTITANPLQEYFAGGSMAYLVGINGYKNLPALQSPHNDCMGLNDVLSQKHGFTVNVLLDPGKQAFLDALEKLKTTCVPDSRVIFYFAGHGVADGMDGDNVPKGFLLPADAERGNHDTYIDMALVMDVLAGLPCRHLLIILDCCYAGAFRFAERTRSIGDEVPKTLYRQKFEFYATEQVKQVITSAACDQKAVDSIGERGINENNRSPFAESLVHSLTYGDGDLAFGDKKPDGVITGSELGFYLSQVVSDRLSANDIPLDNQQMPSVFRIGGRSKGEFIFIHSAEAILNLEDIVSKNPYMGLGDYSMAESTLFYGRQRALYGWWEGKIFNKGLLVLVKAEESSSEKKYYRLVVTGRSGSGKSSLVKAGVLAGLPADCVHSFTPGKTPFTSHQQLLGEIGNAAVLQYLLVDQYEELLTVCTDAAEREQFEAALSDIANNKKAVIIITIRSDIERRFISSGFIGKSCMDDVCRFVVPPFTRDEIKEVVLQPAAQFMLEFRSKKGDDKSNEVFVNSIIDEAFANPDSLPLLSFALSRLYEKRDGIHLTEEEYESFGGITGILDNKFTEAYNSFKQEVDAATPAVASKQQLFRQLIYRMISFDAGTMAKRRVYSSFYQGDKVLNELEFDKKEITENIQAIKDYLVKQRLLKAATESEAGSNATGADNVYAEPSHEALLRSSNLLTQWQNETTPSGISFQNNILLLRSLSSIAQTWYFEEGAVNKHGLLWKNDPRLAYVKKLVSGNELLLNKTEQAFVQASVKAKLRAKLVARVLLVTAFIFIAAAAVIFLFQNKNVTKEKNNALQQKSSALARLVDNYWENSLKALNDNDKVRYLLLLAEAVSINTDSVRNQLFLSNRGLYNFDIFFAGALSLKKQSIEHIVTAGDDRYLLLGTYAYNPDDLTSLEHKPGEAYHYTLWEMKSHKELLPLPADADIPDSLAIIGNRFYFTRGGKKMECWDLNRKKLLNTVSLDSQYYNICVYQKKILLMGNNSTMLLFDSSLNRIAFDYDKNAFNWPSPVTNRLLSYSKKTGTFHISALDNRTGVKPRRFFLRNLLPAQFETNGKFSESGNYFLYLSSQSMLVLVNVVTGQSRELNYIDGDFFDYAQFSPGDKYLIYFDGAGRKNGHVFNIQQQTIKPFTFEIENSATNLTFFSVNPAYRDSFLVTSMDISYLSNAAMFSLSSAKMGTVYMSKDNNDLGITLLASDGKKMAVTDINNLNVYNLNSKQKEFSFPLPNLMPFHLPEFSEDGDRLFIWNFNSIYKYLLPQNKFVAAKPAVNTLWSQDGRYMFSTGNNKATVWDDVYQKPVGSPIEGFSKFISDPVFSRDGSKILGRHSTEPYLDSLVLLNFNTGKAYSLGLIDRYPTTDDGMPVKLFYTFTQKEDSVLFYTQNAFYSFDIAAGKKQLVCKLPPKLIADTSEINICTDGSSFITAVGTAFYYKLVKYPVIKSDSLTPVMKVDVGTLPAYGAYLDSNRYINISTVTMLLSVIDLKNNKREVIAKIGANKKINQVYISNDKSKIAVRMDDDALQVVDIQKKTAVFSKKSGILKSMISGGNDLYLTMDEGNNTLAILGWSTICFVDIKTGIEDSLHFNNPGNEPLKGYFHLNDFYYYSDSTRGVLGADLDMPPALFKQQAMAVTGARLNAVSNQPEAVPEDELTGLVDSYNKAADAHYKVCRYKAFNLWKKINPGVAE